MGEVRGEEGGGVSQVCCNCGDRLGDADLAGDMCCKVVGNIVAGSVVSLISVGLEGGVTWSCGSNEGTCMAWS